MTTPDCKKLQDKFYDYIDGKLSPSDNTEIKNHLANCESCSAEMKRTENLLSMIAGISTPDPGDEFWANSPKNILQAYKDETKKQTSSKQKDFTSKWLDFFSLRPILRYGLAFSVAIAFISVVLIFYPNQYQLNTTSFLAQLKKTEVILQHLDAHPVSNQNSGNLAFSANNKANYFLIGTLYSTGSAYLIAGNRQQSIHNFNLLKSLSPESIAINKKLSQLITLLKTPSSTRTELIDATNELDPLLRNLANSDYENKEMLSLGIWLNNLAIAAATNNKQLVLYPELTNYIRALPEKDIFSPGVNTKIKEIITILESNKIDEKASQRIIHLTQKIQAILL